MTRNYRPRAKSLGNEPKKPENRTRAWSFDDYKKKPKDTIIVDEPKSKQTAIDIWKEFKIDELTESTSIVKFIGLLLNHHPEIDDNNQDKEKNVDLRNRLSLYLEKPSLDESLNISDIFNILDDAKLENNKSLRLSITDTIKYCKLHEGWKTSSPMKPQGETKPICYNGPYKIKKHESGEVEFYGSDGKKIETEEYGHYLSSESGRVTIEEGGYRRGRSASEVRYADVLPNSTSASTRKIKRVDTKISFEKLGDPTEEVADVAQELEMSPEPSSSPCSFAQHPLIWTVLKLIGPKEKEDEEKNSSFSLNL